MKQWIVHSREETMNFAEKMAEHLTANDVLTLSGELGTGKTVFTKGLARGLGIKEMVSSPTFTVVKEYRSGRLPLFHMDVYRISDDEDIGLEDYYDQGGVTVIEWAENIPSWLPGDYLSVAIARTGQTERSLMLSAHGARSETLYREIMHDACTGH
ncbi:tRNA (adenosine(37)-N6)-threonylcarbamoyltransferase complex ATPase subunit type 1 TsaE [Sporolactobacillus sp. THM19-2]|uniref:tRNA (adenosine(37)-N6)-threonylcarbamoyltransferase complex ATPase subunit type 1 TsaE n=1 Tax=Sporolactobacillus sp. THM19-2 TaxID=2511171 RepID=UPI0010227323|nr:tRNA (adenosine(37)-N6)-threonylcarbamoyltransferase complex ATPase subunit type 1 TsaE [Sporolactobacillus sp. THM19-2]RYL88485.1 tRNA (adenosine(37)-N6)-threonylcarbamoyltransferase complex ATPase subunit type 1 TsaE [Sporolactobacillus sp. THM19-2]